MNAAEVKCREFLASKGMEDRIIDFKNTDITAESTAAALGVDVDRICKGLAFRGEEGKAIVIITSGKSKVSNKRFKDVFGFRPSMLPADQTEELVGHAVVHDVNHDVKIHSADGFPEYSLAFTRAEPGYVALDDVGRALVAGKGQRVFVLAFALRAPLGKVEIHLFTHVGASRKRDKTEGAYGNALEIPFFLAPADRLLLIHFCLLSFWL